MMSKKQDSKARPRIVWERRFLVSGLPDGYSPSHPHIQVFDNYIQDSDLRLRKVRKPLDNERIYLIQKLIEEQVVAQIELTETEYGFFSYLRGRETRSNSYEIVVDGIASIYDIYLGKLWGLNIFTSDFESKSEMESFKPPGSMLAEITSDPFFRGANLVDLDFKDIQRHINQNKRDAGGTS